MTVRSDATTSTPTVTMPLSTPTDTSRVYQEGVIAGIVAAATVALWFLIVDLLQGRPLYTPTVLGTALFRHGAGLTSPETLPVSGEMVLMFTWVHGLAFAAMGGVVSRLLSSAERNPNIGFGILLLFVVLQACFVAAALMIAGPILNAVGWWSILVANLLAATAMGLYFWLRHPNLVVEP